MSMKDRSQLDNFGMNLNLNWKGLDFRAITDLYRVTQIDLWGENYAGGALSESFDSYFLQLKYDFEASSGLQLTPFIKYKRQHPWQLVTNDLEYSSLKHTDKLTLGVSSLWTVSEKANLIFGVEYYSNYLKMPSEPGPYEGLFVNGEDSLGYGNFSAYGQLMLASPIANVTVGGRFDYSKEYKSSFVPRIGLTKTLDKFHFKAMASPSFRLPGGDIPNRVLPGLSIKPEKATNFELEVGYRFSDRIFWVINGYDISIKDTIAYLSDPESGSGTYMNAGKVGTRGVESEFRYQGAQTHPGPELRLLPDQQERGGPLPGARSRRIAASVSRPPAQPARRPQVDRQGVDPSHPFLYRQALRLCRLRGGERQSPHAGVRSDVDGGYQPAAEKPLGSGGGAATRGDQPVPGEVRLHPALFSRLARAVAGDGPGVLPEIADRPLSVSGWRGAIPPAGFS